jgi:Zn-dependent M28 family amino/carboxypeptidase
MFADVNALAGDIGPRMATGEAFGQAADLVAGRFTELGWSVERQPFDVPAGISWGVPVPSGRSENVIAKWPNHRDDLPYLIVGAHLDSVPQAPGAEDNASGIAVLLELARLIAAEPPNVQVVLVAFGAEEPRGSGDDAHHFGSRAFVAGLSPASRQSLLGAIAMDRVGVGPAVPISYGGVGPTAVRDALLTAAARAGVPAFDDGVNRSSDHWSFERGGLTGARVGSTPYAAYHSANDVPSVVDPAQLGRTATVVLAAVSALRP